MPTTRSSRGNHPRSKSHNSTIEDAQAFVAEHDAQK